MKVKMYLKSGGCHEFPAKNITQARKKATEIVCSYGVVVSDDGTEEFYPITQIEKVKVVPNA